MGWIARTGALAAAAMTAACSVFGGQAAPEPDYTVVISDGAVEVRDYPQLIVAETTVDGSFDDYGSEAFGRLFGYISGENAGAEEIAMTAPVFMDRTGEDGADGGDGGDGGDGEEIAMTAPVLTEQSDGVFRMAFILPERFTPETAPAPENPDVTLRTIPSRRVAAIGFSGFMGSASVEEERAELDRWLASRNLAHRSDWSAAGYNPPWTLPFLRRNEVLVTLEAAPEG